MIKNLAKHKVSVKTRECIIQALYQSLMEPTNFELLMQQFTKENNPKKISFDLLKSRLQYFFANEEQIIELLDTKNKSDNCLLYTSPSPRDRSLSRMPSSA